MIKGRKFFSKAMWRKAHRIAEKGRLLSGSIRVKPYRADYGAAMRCHRGYERKTGPGGVLSRLPWGHIARAASLRRAYSAIAFAVLAMLTACQSSSEKVLPMNQASSLVNGTIRIGMSRAAVVFELGTPHRIETAGNIEFLFYNAPWTMSWGAISTNPIAITDGKVVGMGSSFYSQHRAG
jgi:hypothetical protein